MSNSRTCGTRRVTDPWTVYDALPAPVRDVRYRIARFRMGGVP
jgi:hypothetical protein